MLHFGSLAVEHPPLPAVWQKAFSGHVYCRAPINFSAGMSGVRGTGVSMGVEKE